MNRFRASDEDYDANLSMKIKQQTNRSDVLSLPRFFEVVDEAHDIRMGMGLNGGEWWVPQLRNVVGSNESTMIQHRLKERKAAAKQHEDTQIDNKDDEIPQTEHNVKIDLEEEGKEDEVE